MIEPTFLYLSTAEAGKALGVSRARINQFVLENRLKAHKIGNHQLAIDPSEIERFRSVERPTGRPPKRKSP